MMQINWIQEIKYFYDSSSIIWCFCICMLVGLMFQMIQMIMKSEYILLTGNKRKWKLKNNPKVTIASRSCSTG